LARNLLLFFLLATVFLSSCVNSKEASIPTETPTTTKTKPTLAATQTPDITQKAEKTPDPESSENDFQNNTPAPTFDFGSSMNSNIVIQESPYISTHEPSNDQYLYKYANVTFLIPSSDESMTRLNLDDLEYNGYYNSDIIIDHSTGSGGTFIDLYTLNGATYYFSNLHGMNYESCMEHYPFTNMDPVLYTHYQSSIVVSQRDYCVLTNDGRLSIFRYVQDTYIPKDWDHVYLELVVTTYNQIVPEVLTPQPTNTPGPSPTPGRYSGMNLTMNKEANLDLAAQTFLDAVTAYDKEKVADLMEYPLSIEYEGYQYLDYAENREEFIAAYDGIFTHNLVEELRNASLEENMGIHNRSILSILVKDGFFIFYPNGKIHYISNSTFWWKNENE